MGGEPKPKERIFLITAQEIPLLIGGDEQRSGDRARQVAANREQAGGDGGHRGTGAEGTGLSKNASCGVPPPPLQHPSVPEPSPPGEGPSLGHPSQPCTHSTRCCRSARREDGGCALVMYSPEKATALGDSVRPAPPRAPRIAAGCS